jgi:GNAT superfamily N-acetyltransferase
MARMTAAELARLEHDNMIQTLTGTASGIHNALLKRTGGVVLLATGLPVRLFNQVLVENEDATVEAMASAVATIRKRGDTFLVNLRVGADDRFISLMATLGLAADPGLLMPGMTLWPIPTDGARSLPGYEIVRLDRAAQLDDHIRATALGLGMPEPWARSLIRASVLGTPGVSMYTGYADGEAVTTGVGFRTGRTIGVYNIATVPAARRHGYGEAMTRRIADDGVRAGCDVATLQASPMGLPIYERMGYRTVVQYRGYVEP